MKYIAFLIIPLLFIALQAGCDNECPNCGPLLPPNCTSIEEINESECLGEALSKGCDGFSCRTESDDFSVPTLIFDCVEIDCNTMECGDIIFADLNIDEVNGLTATVIDNGVDLGNASCGFLQN